MNREIIPCGSGARYVSADIFRSPTRPRSRPRPRPRRQFVSSRSSPLFSLLAICSILMRLLLALPLSRTTDDGVGGDVNFTVFRRTRSQSIGERDGTGAKTGLLLSLSLSLSNRQIITPLELRFSSRIHGRPSPETSNDDALLYQRRAGTVSVLKTLTDGEKKSLVEFLYLVSILAVF